MKSPGVLTIRHLIEILSACSDEAGARLDNVYDWQIKQLHLFVKIVASLAAALFATGLLALLRGELDSAPYRAAVTFAGAALAGLFAAERMSTLRLLIAEYIEAFVLLDLLKSLAETRSGRRRQTRVG